VLRDNRGKKCAEVEILEQEWKQMLHLIRDGIIRKLDSARKLIDIDKDISAGLHTFALEEFGKNSERYSC
jgi:hypothetical protein